MSSESLPRRRWVVADVDHDTPQLAKMLAAVYEVRVGEVLDQALYVLEEYLEDGGVVPDGWTVRQAAATAAWVGLSRRRKSSHPLKVTR